jgi:hypothetical protein
MAATSISDLVIQEREMDLVAGTHGRGIYKMNIRPIQRAYKDGAPQTNILFETPEAVLPWLNDPGREPRYSTIRKVPITFYLEEDAEVEIKVIDKKNMTVLSKTMTSKRGFNQFRWDLIVKKVESPQPYFVHYDEFALPGEYEIRVVGEGIDLKGKLVIREHERKENND